MRADSSRAVIQCPYEGVGLAVVPAVDPANRPYAVPGALPVRVRFDKDPEESVILNSDNLWPGPFKGFELRGCSPGGVYQVFIFKDKTQGRVSAGQKMRVAIPMEGGAQLLSQLAPVDVTSGWEVYPGQVGWDFYFTAAGRSIELYQYSPTATWFPMGAAASIDTTEDRVEFRAVQGAYASDPTRIALKADGVVSAEVVRIFEIG